MDEDGDDGEEEEEEVFAMIDDASNPSFEKLDDNAVMEGDVDDKQPAGATDNGEATTAGATDNSEGTSIAYDTIEAQGTSTAVTA